MSPDDAVEFLRLSNEAESMNRTMAMDDLRFVSLGDQWPANIQNSRKLQERPQLTINKVDAYIRQVTNNQRQQRPRGKAHPVNNEADPKIAEIITGIGRHVETQSDADQAYDTAFDFAVRMGWGYIRMRTDYVDERSMDQDIFIDAVDNPFNVYGDPMSVLPDGSDQNKCLITDFIPKDDFRAEYGRDANVRGFSERGSGDTQGPLWALKDEVRIAEYYWVDKEPEELVKLTDGRVMYADEFRRLCPRRGLKVEGSRPSWKRQVRWAKVTSNEILEETVLPGRWIPVIPVYGVNIMVNGKRYRYGLTRFAKDPARMYNFWKTAMTEIVALAPKAKWLVEEGTIEGHENEYAQANQAPNAVLYWKRVGLDGKEAEKPERLLTEPPPEGAMAMAATVADDLQTVLGIYDPNLGKPDGTDKSGKAIGLEQGQGDNSNYHFYDNLTRSIRHVWRIMLNWVPEVYDTERVMRIIGDDGKPDLVTINQVVPEQPMQALQGGPQQPIVGPAPPDEDEQAAEEIIKNNVRVGQYDVVMDTGPGYNTKRIEAQQAFVQLMGGPLGEEIAQKAADLVIRVFDFPEAEMLADRLAAGNPLAQIDEHNDIPPAVQMAIKQLQAQNQQLQAALAQQQLLDKYKIQPAMIKAQTERQRIMVDAARFHDQDQTKQKDVDQRSATQLEIADKRMAVDLILSHMGITADLRAAMLDSYDNQRRLEHEADSQTSDQMHEGAMAQFQVDNAPEPAGATQ